MDPLERYTLIRKLGQGGMGEVWLAHDSMLDRQVAIKYLLSIYHHAYQDLFLNEARFLAKLNHPNITTIYDIFTDEKNKRFGLVVEYVAGQSLSSLIQSQAIPLDVCLDIVLGVLHALKYAHSKGIIHRDIKPGNIIVSEDIKLTDFGLAGWEAMLREGADHVVGTPAYISPEQASGKPTDGRSDLYSVGVLFFQLVTGGQLPFNYDEQEALFDAHIFKTPPSVRELNPKVPIIVDRVIKRLMAKTPDERYASAEVVINVLGSIRARLKFSKPHLSLLETEPKPFIGLQNELKILNHTWQTVASEQKPHLLIIQGELGSGKSRLVAEFLANHVVNKGSSAFMSSCDEFGEPYAPVIEILYTIIEHSFASPSTIDKHLPIILRQMPGLGSKLGFDKINIPDSNPENIQAEQWQCFEAIKSVLTEIGPAVLFVDSGNFIDEASAEFIRFLASRRRLPVLIILAHRENILQEENSTEIIDSLISGSIHSDNRLVVQITSLSRNGVQEFLKETLEGEISAQMTDTVYERSRGNPLFVDEIVKKFKETDRIFQDHELVWQLKDSDLTQVLPPSLVNLFAQKIKLLSPFALQALVQAAVIGPEFVFPDWYSILGGEDQIEFALDALDEALGLKMLRETNTADHFQFHPPDLASVLAESITPTRRRHIHQKIAKVISSRDGNPALIAYHFQQSGKDEEAVNYLMASGARAAAANAIKEAIKHYQAAIKISESPEAYFELGNLYRQRGRAQHSIQSYQKSLSLTNPKDKESQAAVLNSLAHIYWTFDQYDQAKEAANHVLALDDISITAQADAKSHLGMVAWMLGDLQDAEALCLQSLSIMEQSENHAKLAAAYNRIGLIYFSIGKLSDAQNAFEDGRKLRDELGDYWGQGYCLNNLGQVEIEGGNFELAEKYLDTAQDLFKSIGSDDGLMVVYANQGRSYLRQGRTQKAVNKLADSLQKAIKLGKQSAYGLGDIYLLLAEAEIFSERLVQAQRALSKSLKISERYGNQEYTGVGYALQGDIFAAQDKFEEAENQYQQALEILEEVGARLHVIRTKMKYAKFLKDQGNFELNNKLEKEAQYEAGEVGLYISL